MYRPKGYNGFCAVSVDLCKAVMAFLFSLVFVSFFLPRCHSEEFNPGFTCITMQGIDSAKFLARKSTKLQETSLLKSWSGKSSPLCQHRFDEAIVPVIHCRQIKHTTIFAPGIAVNVTKQRRRKRRCVHYAITARYIPRIIGGWFGF